MNWQIPNNWTAPFQSKVSIYGYITNIVIAKHSDGRIFCTNGVNLQTMDINGGTVVELWTTVATAYAGYTVDKAIILDSGTMLIRLTDWAGSTIFIRSNADYTTFTTVHTDFDGEMLFRGWDTDGTLILVGEYPTTGTIEEVRLWSVTNDGQTWEVLHTFAGRDGVSPEIYHIHCAQYDSFSGLWWIGTGDTDAESRLYSYDGTTLILVGSGSQYWRIVSMAFDANYIYWGIDGAVDGSGYFVRFHKATETLEPRTAITNVIFVTQKLNTTKRLYFSDGHTRYVNNTIRLSNNGYEWYHGFTWIANADVTAYPAFNNFIDGGNGRVYGYVTSIFRHDTGVAFNNGTVIIDVT